MESNLGQPELKSDALSPSPRDLGIIICKRLNLIVVVGCSGWKEQLSLIVCQKLRTTEPQQNFPGSYKKKWCSKFYLETITHSHNKKYTHTSLCFRRYLFQNENIVPYAHWNCIIISNYPKSNEKIYCLVDFGHLNYQNLHFSVTKRRQHSHILKGIEPQRLMITLATNILTP